MIKELNNLDNIILEMQLIQLQLQLAKKCSKQLHSNTPTATEIHINHSIHSLNHLISNIDDFKTDAELKYSASNRTKATLCKT